MNLQNYFDYMAYQGMISAGKEVYQAGKSTCQVRGSRNDRRSVGHLERLCCCIVGGVGEAQEQGASPRCRAL